MWHGAQSAGQEVPGGELWKLDKSARTELARRRRGRESVWELDRRRLKDARRYLDTISKRWDGALLRLLNFVEEGQHGR